MFKHIKILDTTLRDGEQSPGCSMNLSEKIELAVQLEKLGVNVIEAGFAAASNDDFEAVKLIAKTITKATVASLARAVKADIDKAYQAICDNKNPRIHIFIATSEIHMKHKLNMTREEVLLRTAEMVQYAKSLCADIEFSCEDASRSDREFLVKVIETAIEHGATVINIPDTVGYATPDEMFDLIKYIKSNTKGIENIELSVHCHNDLGLAVANTLASLKAGATQVECTVNGIGERAGNASLEEIVMGIKTRKDLYQLDTTINTKQIYRTSKMLSTITGVPVSPNKAIVGANAFAHESGIHQAGVLKERTTYEIMSSEEIGIPQNKMVLGKHSGKHAFADRLEILGYNLSALQIESAFEQFKNIADKKKTITDKDIEALLGAQTTKTENIYQLVGFVVNSGSVISATATVKLQKGEDFIEKVSTGSGPIDAAFKAIDKITKTGAKLENYTIQSVTEGEDALGEVVVKLSKDKIKITGRGLSTDIIEASIKAYLNGVNKIVLGMPERKK